jgi:hypothetical protein
MKAWEILVTATVTLVVVYLLVINYKGASAVISTGANSWATLVAAFQGRSLNASPMFVG